MTEHFKYNEKTTEALGTHFHEVLHILGEDCSRDGLEKTPERVAKSLQFLTSGYHKNPKEILESALFDEQYNDTVIVKDIEFFSLCEHHMLPFFGKAHVAYIPNGKIVGLSKIPRIVEVYARRLQVQERLTKQINECLVGALNPKGVAVIIEASHMCMQMRGVESTNSTTITSNYTGEYLENEQLRREFLLAISSKLS